MKNLNLSQFKSSCISLLLIWGLNTSAILAQYTTLNAHSHNDYSQDIPLLTAYYHHFGSIEADIWEVKGKLLVAHDFKDIDPARTLEKMYIQPIALFYHQNGNKVWKDRAGSFQLMIDVKSATQPALKALIKLLGKYRDVFDPQVSPNAVHIVITGNEPAPDDFEKYPEFISFDGKPGIRYTTTQRQRIALFSADLRDYTSWNGKGNIVAGEYARLQHLIDSIHQLGQKIRFWDAPDVVNAWKTLTDLKVDFVNTDHIERLATYFETLTSNSYTAPAPHFIYTPSYLNNDKLSVVRNVILLIGDGTGLAQQYAGFTANRGDLNLFRMRNIGLSITRSADEYITDSAAGGSALATGKKTQNRHIAVDSLGRPNRSLPELLAEQHMVSGLVTTDEATGATPASFYAHYPERDSAENIASWLSLSPVDLLIGGGPQPFLNRHDRQDLQETLTKKGFQILRSVNQLPQNHQKKVLVLDDSISLSMLHGRGSRLPMATQQAIRLLSQNAGGFFLMIEGAQIDFGGHANNVPYAVSEMLDFDQAIGEALKFADTNGETLVIVTADHETGGLSLLGGDIRQGKVYGQFSSNDHSAIPVPVYAYGPHSLDFRGVFENTEVFEKIMKAVKP